jgi:hypothetical protein
MKANLISDDNVERAIRLFFSLDLVGASKFKYSNPPLNEDIPGWPPIFIEFFQKAAERFRFHIRESADQNGHEIYEVAFWKTLGDEVLFYSTQLSFQQSYWLARAFIATVSELHKDFQNDYFGKLGVKGVIWSAGFPIRNKRIYLDYSNSTSVYEGGEDTSIEASGVTPSPGSIVDFMGLEMDQGFRIATYAYPGRVVCSPDSCYLVALGFMAISSDHGLKPRPKSSSTFSLIGPHPEFRVFQVGWETLKGVLEETPVPILWLEFVRVEAVRELRFSFEAGKSAHAAIYLVVNPMDAANYRECFEKWHQDLVISRVSHIRPYIFLDEKTDESHLIQHLKGKVPNRTYDLEVQGERG